MELVHEYLLWVYFNNWIRYIIFYILVHEVSTKIVSGLEGKTNKQRDFNDHFPNRHMFGELIY